MLAEDFTIYLVNGSSLGGGEMDAIQRASLSGGTIIAASVPVPSVVELARKHAVSVHGMSYLSNLSTDRPIALHLSRFIRDISVLPILVKLRVRHGRRLTITIGLHSDPLSGLEAVKLPLWIALRVFELFCLVFANRIRLVSRRQLKTFPLIARWGRYFIDPPCSTITLAAKTSTSVARDLDLVFIGRISRTRYLGDAKNAAFLFDLACCLPRRTTLHVFGDGNNADLLRSLAGHPRVALYDPLTDVASVLRRTRCLVVPSLHEGYCLLAREASLLECRVLTTDAIADELKNLPGVKVVTGFSPSEWLAAAHAPQ
jgi:hypothetical protein